MLPELHMPEVVIERAGELVTTSLAIAEGTEVEHKNVLGLVRKYADDLDEFGRVAFETRPFETAGGMQRQEIAFLNEPQSTLLLTYMRNSDIVRGFKKALVRAFFELRDASADVAPVPGLPASVNHRADHIVSASRSFNSLLRVGNALRLGHAHAARLANAATFQRTGVDLLEELGITDEDLHAAEPFEDELRQFVQQQTAPFSMQEAGAWLDIAPDKLTPSITGRIGAILRKLGCGRKDNNRTADPSRRRLYLPPSMLKREADSPAQPI
ncbi:Rha family transcriptional regulator [Thauera butanivorans]|uniref:Rha family transcriptional regulator n=1 Tax=Thauera butanivorans TaxID=86174 RepID=UPI0008394FC1|nr:Rha family transcriptional regulator [Thauera butanivorans]